MVNDRLPVSGSEGKALQVVFSLTKFQWGAVVGVVGWNIGEGDWCQGTLCCGVVLRLVCAFRHRSSQLAKKERTVKFAE